MTIFPPPSLSRTPGWYGALGMFLLLAACGTPDAPADNDPPPADAATSAIVFTEVTEAAGLGDFRHVTGAFGNRWFPESMGGGGGFVDYDGDGWYDVVVTGGGTWPEHSGEAPVDAVRLYRNNGDGTFTETTQQAGLSGVHAYSIGLTAADYDNDGD